MASLLDADLLAEARLEVGRRAGHLVRVRVRVGVRVRARATATATAKVRHRVTASRAPVAHEPG